VEVHHIRKHKGNNEHNPERMIALCATCHRKARNPQDEVSRRIARLYLRTGKPDEAKVSRPVWEEA
jgi:5-methylcytosine-specific restriction endonuclease McrA